MNAAIKVKYGLDEWVTILLLAYSNQKTGSCKEELQAENWNQHARSLCPHLNYKAESQAFKFFE
jgi:hypothetical protein